MGRYVPVVWWALGLALWLLPPAAWSAAPTPAAGDPAQPAMPPAARKLTDEGSAALSAGRPAEALAKFEQAYRQSLAPELLWRLGQVAQAQGRNLEAADLYRRYLQEAGPELDAAGQQELRDFVVKPSDGAQRRGAPSLDASDEVGVFGDDGAVLLLDGRVVGSMPLSLPLLVAPGSHELQLEKGRRKVVNKVKLLANRPLQVRFTLVPPLAVATPTAAAIFLVNGPADGGALPEGLLQRVVRAASLAAAQERILLLPRDKLAGILNAAPALKECIDTVACQDKLAAQVQAQYVISLEVDATLQDAKKKAEEGLGNWAFSLKLHDVAAGADAAAGQKSCAGCGVERAGLALGELIGQVAQEGTTRSRGNLAVRSEPAGEVRVDGRQLGTAPAQTEAFVGPHEVEVTLPAYQPYKTTATVTDGETTQVLAALKKIVVPPKVSQAPVQPPPPPRVPLYKKAWLWATVGGVALAGAGVATGLAVGLNRNTTVTAGKTFPFPFLLSF